MVAAKLVAVRVGEHESNHRFGYDAGRPIEVDPEVLAAHAAIADLMSDFGHEIVGVELSVPDPELFAASFTAVWNTGCGGLPVDPEKMEPLNQVLRERAKAPTATAGSNQRSCER